MRELPRGGRRRAEPRREATEAAAAEPAPPARLAPSKSNSPATWVMSRRLSSEAAAPLQASIGLPPPNATSASAPTRSASATRARTELAGTCCPTPANTPAQCGPIAAVTRSIHEIDAAAEPVFEIVTVWAAPMPEADAAGLHHAEEEFLLFDAVACLLPDPIGEIAAGESAVLTQ